MHKELFYKNFGDIGNFESIAIGIYSNFKISYKYNSLYHGNYLHLGFITIFWNKF